MSVSSLNGSLGWESSDSKPQGQVASLELKISSNLSKISTEFFHDVLSYDCLIFVLLAQFLHCLPVFKLGAHWPAWFLIIASVHECLSVCMYVCVCLCVCPQGG